MRAEGPREVKPNQTERQPSSPENSPGFRDWLQPTVSRHGTQWRAHCWGRGCRYWVMPIRTGWLSSKKRALMLAFAKSIVISSLFFFFFFSSHRAALCESCYHQDILLLIAEIQFSPGLSAVISYYSNTGFYYMSHTVFASFLSFSF